MAGRRQPRDVISGNNGDGVDILDSGTTGNLVEGDDIGTTAGGSSGDGNAGDGVSIFSGASDNTLQGDVISDNDADGVNISGSGTNDSLLVGDDIGIDATGSYSLPNYVGVLITNGASGNTIGATSSGTSDDISGNRWDGIEITYGASSNLVEGDNIVTNGASGVSIYGGATNNTIGGTALNDLNISGNTFNGVYLGDSGTSGNLVGWDNITWNGQQGVMIANGASSNLVSEATMDYNHDNGVEMTGAGTSGNTLENVFIRDNTGDGVLFTNGASGDGVTGVNAVSWIQYNGNNGVEVDGGSTNIAVAYCEFSNNAGFGVYISSGSSGTSVVDCYFVNTLGGDYFLGTTNCDLSGNTIEDL